MAKRFLGQSLYYVNQEQVEEEIETGGGAPQEPGLPRDIKNTLGAFCEGLWSILVQVWVCVGFLAAMCISARLCPCVQQSPICSNFLEHQSTVGGRLTVLRPAIVSEKATLSDGALTQEAEVRGGGVGCIHTNMLINTETAISH